MATIPQYTQRTSAPTAKEVPDTRGRGFQALGQGLGRLNDALEAKKEEEAALWASQKMNETQIQWNQELIDRQNNAQPGGEGFTESVVKDYDDYQSQIVSDAPTRASQNFIQERLAAFKAKVASSAMGYEAQEKANQIQSVTDQSIDAGRLLAFQDPAEYASVLAEKMAFIDAQPGTPEFRRESKKRAQGDIAREAVKGIIASDTMGAVEALRAQPGESGVLAIEALDTSDRLVLLETAERKRLADRAFEVQQLEKFEKRQQDDIQKDGDRLFATGQLSADWIEENRDSLSTEDYRYFYKALAGDGDEGVRNVETYMNLREAASFGADIREDARQALTRGNIKVSDYDKLLGEVESSRSNWYKRGSSFIATSSGYSDLNPTPAAAQVKANMLDEWAIWADENPKATNEEARREAKSIVDSYALIDQNDIILTTKPPKYLEGNRSVFDLRKTMQKTREAYENGTLTESELLEQIDIIEKWESLAGSSNAK